MVIIRAPSIFRFAWQTIKHFFSEESRQQMIFADSNYLEELSKWMDIDVLPPCINPNGHGTTAVGMPKNMDCDIIPAHIGKGGVGYVSTSAGGISPASPSISKDDTASLCSTTDDSDSDDENKLADITLATGALQLA